MDRLRLIGVMAAVLSSLALPAAASAETHTFVNTDILYPTLGAGTSGPSNPYPSTVSVSGVAGTVSDVSVTLFGYRSSNAEDADIAFVGPAGRKVMLLSDTCGNVAIQNHNWTFSDSAPSFVPDNGPCGNYTSASFRPSNYVGNAPEPDDLSAGLGGPGPPFGTTLASLSGGSPNGAWRLYTFDDNAAIYGFEVSGWALTLTTVAETAAPTAQTGATGQRAAALKRCKKKRTVKAGRKCRRKARRLPV
jgi:hypothetical protein